MTTENIALQGNLNCNDDSAANGKYNCKYNCKYNWIVQQPHIDSIDAFVSHRYSQIYESYLSDFTSYPDNEILLSRLPPPTSFPDMLKSVDRILEAKARDELVIVFGDFDVDGTTSCALLRMVLTHLQIKHQVYIPDRLKEGYGLNPTGVNYVADLGAKLIITVDNGIAALEACLVAKSRGVDVIITDHHDLPPVLPDCFSILNPKVPNSFPYRYLAGVGVAFYLAMGIRSTLRLQNNTIIQGLNLKSLLDLVAIGTIADMAPQTGLNHVLCRVGLQILSTNIGKGMRTGIKELLKLSGWVEGDTITETDIGFRVAPRLNAAGRLGSALAAEKVLSTTNEVEANQLAAYLHNENYERRQIEKEALTEAHEEIQSYSELPDALVLYQSHWHPGVVGLIASRLAERYHRPALALCQLDGKIKGSGRSIAGFDLFSSLNSMRHLFEAFGGHPAACGMTLKPDALEPLMSAFNECAKSFFSTKLGFKPQLPVAGVVPVQELSLEQLEKLEILEPFGIENARPAWQIPSVVLSRADKMGKQTDSNHASLYFEGPNGNFRVVAFDMYSRLIEMAKSTKCFDIVVDAKVATWNGRTKAELRLLDIRAH